MYLLHFFTTSVSTYWMVPIFSLPVFGAYGRAFTADQLFWPLLIFLVPLVAITASAFALPLAVAIVYLFLAKRTKDIILYLNSIFAPFGHWAPAWGGRLSIFSTKRTTGYSEDSS
ncbi:MAG: hypothetical protein KJ630_22250 [Proteobacteria bacterium]|nr:hypothetical protein [Pseudomonadota bacterium]